MRSYWPRVGPQSTMCIQCEGQAKTQKHWEGGHVTIEAETGLRQPQVKEGHRVPAVTRSWGGTERFSPRSFGGSMALPASQLSPMVTLHKFFFVFFFFKMKISLKAFQLFLKALVNVRQGTYFLLPHLQYEKTTLALCLTAW